MAGSTAEYCALSHISRSGALLRCLDLSYLKGAASRGCSGSASCGADVTDEADSAGSQVEAGSWSSGWQWSVGGGRGEEGEAADDAAVAVLDPVDALLERSLEEVLDRYPRFKEAFHGAPSEKQDMWRQGWERRDETIRCKLRGGVAKGIFTCSNGPET
jgi:hypothetical protein